MDHSSHDHHMMDHSAHGGHGDMGGDGSPKCNMNMLFTWDTTDLCVVFRQWHITSTMSLVVSLAAIVAICAGYEALREGIRQYEAMLARRVDTAPLPRSPSPLPSPRRYFEEQEEESATETAPFLGALRTGQNREQVTRQAHVTKAVLYGVQNFYAFMIMLIFMTYNGWVMIAVSVGAGLGYLVFGGRTPVTKETACH
ncbi:Ctr copper transporter family-domain-containing protein [Parachaetomium inaequale]|uniref:Copper transport protein n=1 Tax=Parachaetomium inaequale TaxID=2588326 RepID=A0AAN6STC3_9PEZI|nr:Ctr copper transporter family-domain-containing protein [Parachaetomium inaequale]